MVQYASSVGSDSDSGYDRSCKKSNTMDLFKTSHSYNSLPNGNDARFSTICKRAILKKAKTNRNKFFVLHKASSISLARLEYYDTESQFNKQKKPRRVIYLRSCFCVNPYADSQTKFGLILYTKDDSFQISFPSEQDRDMWLADMRYLSRSESEQIREPVQHQWTVNVATCNTHSQICGQYFLLLDDKQASLFKKTEPERSLQFPFDIVMGCEHKNSSVILIVSEQSQIGAGEIWLDLDDSLIAQNVYRALLKPGRVGGEFRPLSKSVSHSDRLSKFRIRSGSDARRKPDSCLMSSLNGSPTNHSDFSINNRDRSDSVGSHTTNISAEDSDVSSGKGQSSRPATPSSRNCKRKEEDTLCQVINSCNSEYAEMSCYGMKKAQDKNSNVVYFGMSGSSQMDAIKSNLYVDMTFGQKSPSSSSVQHKPDVVHSYLIEDDEHNQELEKRHNSLGCKLMHNNNNDDYVVMCRTKLSAGDKCSSAPHLNPVISNPQIDQSNHTNVLHRPALHTSHRPRGSTWSQYTRPCGPQTPATECQRTSPSDYIDMSCGRRGSCIETSDKKYPKLNSSLPDNKENYQTQSRPSSRTAFTEPFPELSTSSGDDMSLHSMEGSMSLHSLSSSADSMSVSSHSLQNGYVGAYSHFESEPYVAMQPVPIALLYSSHQQTGLKPCRMQSFIRDESSDKSGDYRDMKITEK